MAKKQDESQFDIEAAYPKVAEWVQGCGWIEIGNQDWQGFVVRALNEGGVIYEKEGCRSLRTQWTPSKRALGKWLRENG